MQLFPFSGFQHFKHKWHLLTDRESPITGLSDLSGNREISYNCCCLVLGISHCRSSQSFFSVQHFSNWTVVKWMKLVYKMEKMKLVISRVCACLMVKFSFMWKICCCSTAFSGYTLFKLKQPYFCHCLLRNRGLLKIENPICLPDLVTLIPE